MEAIRSPERIVRIEGKWNHEIKDFKKLYVLNDDHEIANVCQYSASLPADEKDLLSQYRQVFNGAHALPIQDGQNARSTAYMMTPPVARNAQLDSHIEMLGQRVQQKHAVLDLHANHVVGFGSAGHAIEPGNLGFPTVTAKISVDTSLGSTAWKTGITITARDAEPVRANLATSAVSPPVPGKPRTQTPEVKATPSSNLPVNIDYLVGVIRAKGDPYGVPFPYTTSQLRTHKIPWWYVPTGEEPQRDLPYYILSIPGPVSSSDVGSIYKIPGNTQAVADAMNREVLLKPDTLSISVGNIIGYNNSFGKIGASTTYGSSGGAVGKLGHEPLALIGTHIKGRWDDSRLCSDVEANFNFLHRVTEPYWACGYVETILPILRHVPDADWPGAYMKEHLISFFREAAVDLQAQNLWQNVESFARDRYWVL